MVAHMERRLKLLHLVWCLDAAGMENGVINICHRLPSSEFAPAICTLKAGGAAEQRLDPDRVELLHCRRLFGRDLSLPVRLALLLRRQRVDIVHTHNWVTLWPGLLAAKLAGVPLVVHGEHGKIWDRRRQVIAQRWLWRRTHQVLSVSAALADRMSEAVGFPRARIEVISNGVDTERFRPSGETKTASRQRLGLPAEGLLIGMVARLVPFKDHAGVLRAVAALQARQLDIHLALAGAGPLRDELDQLATELGIAPRVHFLGELPQVDPLLGALDVLVSNSSHNEGMSNAVLEAMACGVPIIATRVAASPELLDHGRAGILIEPRDAEGLAAALGELHASPALRARLGESGRQRIEEQYSLDAMVGAYRRLYLRLAGNSRAVPAPAQPRDLDAVVRP